MTQKKTYQKFNNIILNFEKKIINIEYVIIDLYKHYQRYKQIKKKGTKLIL